MFKKRGTGNNNKSEQLSNLNKELFQNLTILIIEN